MAEEERIEGYTAALFELARAEDRVDRVVDELYRFSAAVAASPPLRDTLADPRIPRERKHGVVADLLGPAALPLTMGLVDLLVAAGRSDDLPEISARLAERAAAEREHVIAEVSTAVALEEATVRRLEEALSRATGKQVEVRATVDPLVLGGLVARVEGTVIDGTLRRRFEELRRALTAQQR